MSGGWALNTYISSRIRVRKWVCSAPGIRLRRVALAASNSRCPATTSTLINRHERGIMSDYTNRGPRVVNVAAVALMSAAITLLFGSSAQAQVIRACVQKDSLQVRIIGPSEVCRQTEFLVTWNQQGVKGDKGVPGDKGDPGDKGEPGDKGDTGSPGVPGLSGYEIVTATHTLPRYNEQCGVPGFSCVFEWLQLTASCPTGKKVLSGSHN